MVEHLSLEARGVGIDRRKTIGVAVGSSRNVILLGKRC